MEFPSVEQSLTQTRADFDMATFRRLIAQKGLSLSWSQCAECPCQPKSVDRGFDLSDIDDVDSGTGSVLGCPVCKGKGHIYHSPQDTQGIITNAEGEYLNARYGGYKEGLVSITLNPEHLPVFGDRFTLKNSVMIYRETITMVDGKNTYDLSFPIASRVTTLATGEATHDIIYLHIADQDTGLAIVGGDHTTDWRGANQGYVVTDGKFIRNNVGRLKDGMRVSISYLMHPTYTVVSYPNSVRDTRIRKKTNVDVHTPMPVRVQAKLEFLELET
jgi:hypothetical protein